MPSRARVQALPRWSSEMSWISSNTATAQCPDFGFHLHWSWTHVCICICIWYAHTHIYIYTYVFINVIYILYFGLSIGNRYLSWIEKKKSVTAHVQNLQMSVGNPLLFIPWVGLTGHCFHYIMFCKWFLVSFFSVLAILQMFSNFWSSEKCLSVSVYSRSTLNIHLLDPI